MIEATGYDPLCICKYIYIYISIYLSIYLSMASRSFRAIYIHIYIYGVSINGATPIAGWFQRETPSKMADDLGPYDETESSHILWIHEGFTKNRSK